MNDNVIERLRQSVINDLFNTNTINQWYKFRYKKNILLMMMAYFSLCCYSQSIEGIGKLKLNMTLNEVKKSFPKSLMKMQTTSKLKNAYRISAYTPIPNHTLKDIRLYFYNDTLYAFYIQDVSPYLEYSLKTKYGEPKETRVSFGHQLLETTAIYEFDSADFLLEATKKTKNNISTFFYNWNEGNPFAQCVLVESVYTNEKNERDMDIIFYMRDRVTAKLIEAKEEIQKEEEKENKKKELDGL